MKSLALLLLGLLAAGSGCGGQTQTMTATGAQEAMPAETASAPSRSTTLPPGPGSDAGTADVTGQPPVVEPAPAMSSRPVDPESAATPDEPTRDGPTMDSTRPPGEELPCEAQGLPLEGLVYSPGGTRLPHPCKPFHPTLNNPFAVRCIDAWPWYETGFPGDELCILPPEPGKGLQYGAHPQGTDWYAQVSTGDMSGYHRANIPEGFVVPAGEEESDSYRTRTHATESHPYYRSYVRMRTGAYRMFAGGSQSEFALEEWVGEPSSGAVGEPLPNALRLDENVPMSLDKPEGDAGLHATVSNPTVTIEVNSFNPTDDDLLRETWTNLWFEDDATIRIELLFGFALGQSVQTFAEPGQTVDAHYSWPLTSDVRLIDLIGHRHAWTSNFSVWVEKPDGATEILYQSFDWRDPPRYRFDSLTQNPAPAAGQRLDGACSGIRILEAGQVLHFNCHIEFTELRAVAEGAPLPSSVGTLRFVAGRSTGGEMCILFGSTAGEALGVPEADPNPVPDFTSVE